MGFKGVWPGKNGGKKKKELLFGLVQNHDMDEEELQDLVAEKGKGLIFLLYGAPSVGKTSTGKTRPCLDLQRV